MGVNCIDTRLRNNDFVKQSLRSQRTGGIELKTKKVKFWWGMIFLYNRILISIFSTVMIFKPDFAPLSGLVTDLQFPNKRTIFLPPPPFSQCCSVTLDYVYRVYSTGQWDSKSLNKVRNVTIPSL